MLDIWILDLDMTFRGQRAVRWPSFRAEAATQGQKGVDTRASYLKKASLKSPEAKQKHCLSSEPQGPPRICHLSALSPEGCTSQPIRNANLQLGAGLTDPVGGDSHRPIFIKSEGRTPSCPAAPKGIESGNSLQPLSSRQPLLFNTIRWGKAGEGPCQLPPPHLMHQSPFV